MGSFNLFRQQNKIFWENFWKYSQIIILIQLLIAFIFVPILNFLTSWILKLGHVNYVSYNNLIFLMTKKPLVILGLLVILLFILVLVFSQFALLLVSFQAIKSNADLKWRDYFKNVFKQLYGLPFKAFGFFLLYFLLIIPFAGIGFSSNLLNKVKIPEFIIEWLFQEHLPFAILLMILYVIVLYIGLRLIFVLPLMIFDNLTVRRAIRKSFQLTKNKILYYLGTFLILLVFVSAFALIIFGIILVCQWGFDRIHIVRFPIAVLNLTLVQLINIITSIYGMSLTFLVVLHKTKTTYVHKNISTRSHKWFWMILAGATVASFMVYNVSYFKGWLLEPPVTISHRGVDDSNEVQNSIPALEKTAKEKPDYIEMDVQETKDHQFVVYHDSSLKKLAGINKRPAQMTLNELTKVPIHENGYTAHIASFNDYLRAATNAHQKLLVEFKKNSTDTSDFVQLFAKRYGKQLQQNGDMVHSLNYNYIEQSKEYMPKVKASYILSFNLSGVPISRANDFTMEYSTLNEPFIEDAHIQRKKVFAWTVNDTDTMDRMIFIGADGIVTDNLTDLQNEMNGIFNNPSYAVRILNYIVQMQSPF